VPGRHKCQRYCRPLGERPGFTNGYNVHGPRLGVLRESTLGLVADDMKLVAATIKSLIAPIAVQARLARWDEHALAELQRSSSSAHFCQNSGHLTAAYRRHGNFCRQPLPGPDIEMVERAGLYLDQPLVIFNGWLRQVHHLQDFGSAGIGKGHGTHESVLLDRFSKR